MQKNCGHYYTNTLYNSNYSEEEIRKREYRANKWKLKALVPCSKLKELCNNEVTYSYELAEKLGVTENLIKQAYNYYKENSYI